MSNPINCPPISSDLIKFLESRFPDRCPPKGADYGDIMFDSGSALVVSVLKREKAKQEENILNTKL